MDFECQICIQKPSEHDKIILECIHTFCSNCISRWAMENPSCPVCRNKIGHLLQQKLQHLCTNFSTTFRDNAQQQPSHLSLTADELEERGERGEFYRRFASPPFELYDWGKSKRKTT